MKHYSICCDANELSTLPSPKNGDGIMLNTATTGSAFEVHHPPEQDAVDSTASTPSRKNSEGVARELYQETKPIDSSVVSGVEVTPVSIVPILCTDTTLTATKTFGDESVASAPVQDPNEPSIKSNCEAIQSNGVSNVWSSCHVCAVGEEASELGVEVAFAPNKEPLLKKIMRYVPLTPHQRQKLSDLNFVVDDDREATVKTSSDHFPEVLEARDESEVDVDQEDRVTIESREEASPRSKGEEEEPEDLEEEAPVDPTAASVDVTDRGEPTILRRVQSTPGKSVVAVSSSLAEIRCSPTFDPKGALKEQFETKMDDDLNPKMRKKRWNVKSVVFGMSKSQSAATNAAGGPLRSILRKRMPLRTSLSLKDAPQTPASSQIYSIGSQAKSLPATLTSTRSWHQRRSWSRRRTTTIARPYTDAETKRGDIELVKHSIGMPHPTYLQSVTFDHELDNISQGGIIPLSWAQLRLNKTDVIPEEKEIEDEADNTAKPPESTIGRNINISSACEQSQSLLNACSPTNCLPDHGKSAMDAMQSLQDVVRVDSLNAEPHAFASDNEGGIVPPQVEKSDTITNHAVKSLPATLPRSSSQAAYAMHRSASQRSRPTLHYPIQQSHSEPSGKGTPSAKKVPTSKPHVPRVRQCKTEHEEEDKYHADDDEEEIPEEDFERKLAKVAQFLQRPNQTLKDAMEELEVELLEARSFKQRSLRQIKFKEIREKTRQIIKDHSRKSGSKQE